MGRTDHTEWLDEMLTRYLRREPVVFNFEEWARNHPNEAALVRSGFAQSENSRLRVQFAQTWRRIMRSPYTRYVSAGIVLLALLSFLFPGSKGSIALADVQKALEAMQTARVTGVRNCFLGDDQEPTCQLGVEKLFSVSYGYVDRTFTADGKLLIEFRYHLPTGTVTALLPTAKRYYRMQIPEAHRDELKKMAPEAFIEALFVSGDYRQLEPKDVQGVEAVGFEVSDLTERFWGGLGGSQKMADIFFPVRALNARMWVDRTTRLPILVEAEGEIHPCLLTGYRKMRGIEINDHWEFDVPLDEAQFQPKIPEDYEVLGLPVSVKMGAAVSGISLAGAPFLFMAAGRSRRRCG